MASDLLPGNGRLLRQLVNRPLGQLEVEREFVDGEYSVRRDFAP
jgi:hypothetical protein